MRPDYSHFEHPKWSKPLALDYLLVENSTYNRGNLKRRLIKESLLENKCNECGQSTTWNTKPLVLIIDHKNGVNNDNRIGNLQLLCPNCNNQTSTFGGRNCKRKKATNYCECGEPLTKNRQVCRRCYLAKFGLTIEGPKFCVCGKKIKKRDNQCRKCWVASNKKKESFTIIKGMTIQRDELSNIVTQHSLESIGKKYGVTGAAIKKHCKKLEIPLGNRRTQNGTWKQF